MTVRPTVSAPRPETDSEAVEEALASARLEGLEPTPGLLGDLRLIESGEINSDELAARTLARHRR